ncbi:MAG: hypothetical protein JWM40_2843, partial [Frankiales bacterium]|nr:hypothetical protein [Frankiales bacterium]
RATPRQARASDSETGRDSDYDRSATRLETAGWRVLRVAHGTTLASVWPQAGQQRVHV